MIDIDNKDGAIIVTDGKLKAFVTNSDIKAQISLVHPGDRQYEEKIKIILKDNKISFKKEV